MNNFSNIESSFPHPVLGNSDDIVNGKFIINAKGRIVDGQYEIKIFADIGIQNEAFDKLLENSQIKFVIDVYCQQTLFKRSYTSGEKTIPLCFSQTDLRGKVEFVAYLIATEDITNLKLKNQNKVFGDTTFNVNKGDWLGISNKLKQHLDPIFDNDDLNKKKPIIRLDSDKTSQKNYFKISWISDQLVVLIPHKLHKEWSRFNTTRYGYINWCAIILPVLTEAINKIDSDEDVDYRDLKWYHVIQQEIEKLEIDHLDNSVKAQILLDGPFKKMVKQLEPLEAAYQGEIEE